VPGKVSGINAAGPLKSHHRTNYISSYRHFTPSLATMLKKPALLRTCKRQSHFHQHQTIAPKYPISSKQCRPYAIAYDRGGDRGHDRIPWPDSTTANTTPTPYQIFGQKKGSPYSKRRFYELVKLYHPDRHSYSGSRDGLSYATKLERYRLIVAANDILSDPGKRNAYDRYGAGWNEQPGIRGPQDTSDRWGKGGGWNSPYGPSRNATWEDWEKWYKRDEQGNQEPVYLSNGAFVCLVVLFAAVGGIAHAARAGKYSMTYLEHQDALQDDISKELRRRRQETLTAYPTREERVHEFLRKRDQQILFDPRDEKDKRLPPPH
jgi:curved DNA-binding protein CbpA